MEKREASKVGAAPAGRRRPVTVAVECVLVAGLAGFFLILKSYGLNPAVSDENIYFYSAWLMREGWWPYRDFFFAHPPLHIVPGWLLLLVTRDFSLTAMKMLPVVAATASGVCIYFWARRAAGVLAAAVACLLFYTSHDLLRASSHWTGINCALAWMAGGLLAAFSGRAVLGGVLLGLGASTGVYITPAAVMAACLLGLARPRAGLRTAAAIAGVWVLVNGFFWATCGSGYIDGAYRYHFLKPVQAGAGLADEIGQVLFHNFFLVAAPVYLAPAAAFLIFRSLLDDASRGDWRRYFDPSREPVLAAAIWTTALWAGNLLFLSRLGQVFDYYFLLLFPPAAVAGGLLAATLWTAVRAAPRSRAALAGGVFLITLVCVGLLIYPRFERGLGYYAANAGKTKTYSFPHSPLPEALQWPVRAPFWSPDRTVGRRYTGILFYLWHESREFDTAREIAAVLRENARPGETIFGDSTSTPLVALLAGVPITDRFPDTNSMRFECGLPAPAAAARQLEAALERDNDRLAWVLLIPGRGIASRKPAVPGKRREWRFSELMDFFGERFQPFRSFPTAEWGTYQLWRRRDVPLPAGAPGGGRGGAGGVESGGGEVEPAAPEEN